MADPRDARDRVARRVLAEADRRHGAGRPPGRTAGVRSFADAQRVATSVAERNDAERREGSRRKPQQQRQMRAGATVDGVPVHYRERPARVPR